MKLIRHAHETPPEAKGAVIAAGNFDGVHRGHQQVIAETRRLAAAANSPAAVMTFEPHPRTLFAPDAPPFRLTPFHAKARLIEDLGVDALFALAFTRALAAFSPDQFIEQVLARGAACAHIVTGAGFRFGKDRAGDVETLRRAGQQLGFEVTALAPVSGSGSGGEAYSSTAVRARLAAGDAAGAAEMLGRPHEIHGHAQSAGADAGAGAVRIMAHEISLPAEGAYAARLCAEKENPVWMPAHAELRHVPGPDGRLGAEFIVRPSDGPGDGPGDGAPPEGPAWSLAGRRVRLALTSRA